MLTFLAAAGASSVRGENNISPVEPRSSRLPAVVGDSARKRWRRKSGGKARRIVPCVDYLRRTRHRLDAYKVMPSSSIKYFSIHSIAYFQVQVNSTARWQRIFNMKIRRSSMSCSLNKKYAYDNPFFAISPFSIQQNIFFKDKS